MMTLEINGAIGLPRPTPFSVLESGYRGIHSTQENSRSGFGLVLTAGLRGDCLAQPNLTYY